MGSNVSTRPRLRRLLRVYTPPGYSAVRKYPVLYLHHGLGNTSTEWTPRARAPIIVDNLLAEEDRAVHHRLPQRERDRHARGRKAG